MTTLSRHPLPALFCLTAFLFTAQPVLAQFVGAPPKGNCDPRFCHEFANCLADGGFGDISISPSTVALGETLTITFTGSANAPNPPSWPASLTGGPSSGRGGKFIRWQSETMCGGPGAYPALTRVSDCAGQFSCDYELTATGSMEEDEDLGGRPWAIVRIDFATDRGLAWDEAYFGVVGENPTADFTFEVSEENSLQVNFDASDSEAPDGEIATYDWDFDGDGEVDEQTDESQINYTYDDEGTYEATLTVTSDTGQESDPFSEQVEVEAVRWRYEVALESTTEGQGKRSSDEPVESQVGDTVLVRVKVENSGGFPLEDIQVVGGAEGIEITSEVDALSFTEARTLMIERLGPGEEGEMVFAYEAAHAAEYTVFVAKVEATSVNPNTEEREQVMEIVTSCATGDKRSGNDPKPSQGCANGEVKVSPTVVNSTKDDPRGTGTDGNPLKGCDTGGDPVEMDDGTRATECTLRAAIEMVNAGDFDQGSGVPKITFKIPGTSPTITVVGSALTLEKTAVIDGTTQAGYDAGTGQPAVELRGSSNAGLTLMAAGSKVRGLAIGSFSEAGILVKAPGVLIEKNHIGTDRNGSIAQANGTGILIDNVPNTKVRDNLISGNTNEGLKITGANAKQTTVEGNITGANKGLTEIIANEQDILILDAPSNVIGGAGAAARNYITGTLAISGEEATDNVVQGNYIGTNRQATYALGNGELDVFSAQRTTIGSSSGVGNLIAGGIYMSGSSTHVEGNLIGLQPDGETTLEMGNCGFGIEISVSHGTDLQSPAEHLIKNNRIAHCTYGLYVRAGGSNLIVDNTIFANRKAGVVLLSAAQGQSIRANAIYKNGGLGIDHNEDGITFNTLYGENNVQDYPILPKVTAAGRGVSIRGHLNTPTSHVGRSFTVDFFSNLQCDRMSGAYFPYGEGEHYLGSITTTAGLTGTSFEYDVGTLPEGHRYITATATNEEGNTSEFSICRKIVIPDQVVQTAFDPEATGSILDENGVRVTVTNAAVGKSAQNTATLFASRYEEAPDSSHFSGTSALTNDGSSTIPDTFRRRHYFLATSDLLDNEGNPITLTYDLCLDASNVISSWYFDQLLLIQRNDQTGGLWTPLNTYIVQEDKIRYACTRDLTQFGEFGFASGGVTALNTPTLVWPEDGSEEVPLSTDLSWESVPDAISYDVQLALNPSFATTLIDTTGLSGTTLPFSTKERVRVHYWRVRGIAATGEVGPWSSTHRFTSAVTGVALEEEAELPTGIVLAANYPNPFNPQTTIPFALPESMRIRLVVYDMLGRAVRVLVDESLPAGRHEAVFEAGRLPSGVYLYRLEAEGQTFTQRMLLLK